MLIALWNQIILIACIWKFHLRSSRSGIEKTLEREINVSLGETVFVGSKMGAVRFVERFVTRIPYVDCIILPTLHAIASDHQGALEIVDMLNDNGVEVVTWVDGEFQEIRSTMSALRAFYEDEIRLN